MVKWQRFSIQHVANVTEEHLQSIKLQQQRLLMQGVKREPLQTDFHTHQVVLWVAHEEEKKNSLSRERSRGREVNGSSQAAEKTAAKSLFILGQNKENETGCGHNCSPDPRQETS